MRFEGLSSLALFGLATSTAIQVRAPAEAAVAAAAVPAGKDDDKGKDWRPHTKEPHFFNLRVNDRCDAFANPPETMKSQCPFDSYAVRLEKGILVVTPYNKWWDPALPVFFVDDDTQLYTVSKDPLQLYVDSVTGAVKYTKVGYMPPSAISTGFYHTGNNPIQLVDPSPSYLTWPSTYGITKGGNFALCPLGSTGQYQVFVNNWNFDQQGVEKRRCKYYALAALNANPWKKDSKKLKARDYPTSDDDSWSEDPSDSWSEDDDDSWSSSDDSKKKDDSSDSWSSSDDSKKEDPKKDDSKKEDPKKEDPKKDDSKKDDPKKKGDSDSWSDDKDDSKSYETDPKKETWSDDSDDSYPTWDSSDDDSYGTSDEW